MIRLLAFAFVLPAVAAFAAVAASEEKPAMPNLPTPPTPKDTADLGKCIQRAMTLMATSTPQMHHKVKVLLHEVRSRT